MATSLDHNAELWMNRSPHSGHWLGIALHGVQSNRDGIGTRIEVVTKSGVQYNHQTSSVCYASSSLGPVHFGLGPDDVAEKIILTWPSGIVQTLENVKADRIVQVRWTAPEMKRGLSLSSRPSVVHIRGLFAGGAGCTGQQNGRGGCR